ncbi:hypothetical protein C8Q80DRAFT_302418 [Daedaleopsis nitida]|nr:hypothetical protein C8Q80DRAFT_302418 [Daedaleopsis nitida]
MLSRTVIDDVDPAIKYSAGWTPSIAFGSVLDGTTHTTSTMFSNITLEFNGTGVQVVGLTLVEYPPPTAAYTIDGISMPASSLTPSGVNEANITLLSQHNLPIGMHTLVITNLGGLSNPYWLDYFVVSSSDSTQRASTTPQATTTTSSTSNIEHMTTPRPGSSQASIYSSVSNTTVAQPAIESTSSYALPLGTSTPSPMKTTNNIIPSASSSSTASPVTTATPTNATSQQNHKGLNLIALIGGTSGGAVFVLLFVVLLICRRRGQGMSSFFKRRALATQPVSPFLYTSSSSVAASLEDITPSSAGKRTRDLSGGRRTRLGLPPGLGGVGRARVDPPSYITEDAQMHDPASILVRVGSPVSGMTRAEPPVLHQEETAPPLYSA